MSTLGVLVRFILPLFLLWIVSPSKNWVIEPKPRSHEKGRLLAKIPLVGFQALPGVVWMALAKIALIQIFATASDFDIAQKFAAKLAMALSLAAKLKPFQMSSCFQLLPASILSGMIRRSHNLTEGRWGQLQLHTNYLALNHWTHNARQMQCTPSENLTPMMHGLQQSKSRRPPCQIGERSFPSRCRRRLHYNLQRCVEPDMLFVTMTRCFLQFAFKV